MCSAGAPGPAPVAGGVGGIVTGVAADFPGPAVIAWGGGDHLITEIAKPAVAELTGSGAAWDLPRPWAAGQKVKVAYL